MPMLKYLSMWRRGRDSNPRSPGTVELGASGGARCDDAAPALAAPADIAVKVAEIRFSARGVGPGRPGAGGSVPRLLMSGCRPRTLVRVARRQMHRAPPVAGGPRVRIRFAPADSPSLRRIRFRRSITPAFRAGVRGWLGDRLTPSRSASSAKGTHSPWASVARLPRFEAGRRRLSGCRAGDTPPPW